MFSSLEKVSFEMPTCDEAGKESLTFESGSVSSSQFFVAVGVLAFLYSLAAIVLYVFFDDLYRKENKIIIGVRLSEFCRLCAILCIIIQVKTKNKSLESIITNQVFFRHL